MVMLYDTVDVSVACQCSAGTKSAGECCTAVLDVCRVVNRECREAVQTTPPHHHSTTCGKRAGAFSPLENESLQNSTILQRAPPTLVSENVGNGPENVVAASQVLALEGGAGGVSAQVSGADLEISSGCEGGEVERCEGCGRTFAPGRLQSHAKVNQLAPTVDLRFVRGCYFSLRGSRGEQHGSKPPCVFFLLHMLHSWVAGVNLMFSSTSRNSRLYEACLYANKDVSQLASPLRSTPCRHAGVSSWNADALTTSKPCVLEELRSSSSSGQSVRHPPSKG